MKTAAKTSYGTGDTSFRAAGGEDGIKALVDAFYDTMQTHEKFRYIFTLHPDGHIARDKLTRFLCGWLGGPKRYQEKYGSINIPHAHAHLNVKAKDGANWLACMAIAIEQQPYSNEFKKYLLDAFHVPVERIISS